MASAIPAKAILLLLLGASPAAAGNAAQTVFVTSFSFLDTSGEVRDQSAEHAERLAAMSRDLRSDLERKGLYRVVTPPVDASPCGPGDTACILKQAREAGAEIVLAGAVQKVSTMASSLWVGAFDASDGKRVFFRQMTFRGDTDEAWQHATAFLSREIEDDPPQIH